jgi:fucose 4-O-acetylase-like acetyltransferase
MPPERETWIDQARWVAIALVVIGHVVGPLRGSSVVAKTISDFVYVFHIPALVLLAGWGARRASASGRGLTRLFWALLVPYVLFQIVAILLGWSLFGHSPSWVFVYPSFGLWFLLSLASWRLLAPWFHGLPAPVLPALAVALLAGASPHLDSFLSLQRTAYFLPMFIAGPWIVDRVSVWRQRARVQIAALAVLVLALVVVYIRETGFDRTIFFGRDSYDALGQGLIHGMLARLLALAIASTLAIALLLAIPGGALGASRLGVLVAHGGQHTMYPYLLHLPFLLIAAWTGWYSIGSPHVTALGAALVGLTLAVVFVTPPVRWVAGPLVEPRAWWDRVRALTRAGSPDGPPTPPPPAPPPPAAPAPAPATPPASRIVEPR